MGYSAGEFVVLDADAGSVTLFSPDLRDRTSWGRRGSGPGEFTTPVALTDGGTADTLWIVDAGSPPHVKVFSRAGELLLQFPTEGAFPVDIARDSEGTIYVAHRVSPRFAARDPDRFATLVARYSSAGEPLPPLVEFDSTSFFEERLVLPGLNTASVEAEGKRIAVAYPSSGFVDIYQDGLIETTARVCFPEALRLRYREQRAEAAQHRRIVQRHFPLITGTRITEDGGVDVVTSFPDGNSRYHVDHFSPSGRSLGSTVFDADYIRLPRTVGFVGASNELFGFDDNGLLATFDLLSSPPPGVRGESR